MDDEKEVLPATTPQETALDVGALVSSIVPWVGGPVNAVLAGISLTRKINRVREVLVNMAEQIKDVKSEISEAYVKTEDFQDLLEKTLRQAADERNEEKRKAYAAFLAGDIKSPGQPYDEKLRILRTLEEIQADHIQMLKALMLEPDHKNLGMTGSIGRTLEKRLPGISRDRINDLAQQLTDMRLANLGSLNTMMTTTGAEELQHTIMPYGRRFIRYILSA
jgi:hypothetical protein